MRVDVSPPYVLAGSRERRERWRLRRRRRRQAVAATVVLALAAAVAVHVERRLSDGGAESATRRVGPFGLPTPTLDALIRAGRLEQRRLEARRQATARRREARLLLRRRADAETARFARTGVPLYCGGPRPYVALTFDDGPWRYTRRLVRILAKERVRVTVFLIGRQAETWPNLAAIETHAGEVGDHSWSHPYLTTLSDRSRRRQLTTTRDTLLRTTRRPVRLFRPPYGARDERLDALARELGLLQVLWSIDTSDYLRGTTAQEVVNRVMTRVQPGSIVLLHETHRTTLQALPLLLHALRARGLRPVTVPELLALDAPGDAQFRRGLSACGDQR